MGLTTNPLSLSVCNGDQLELQGRRGAKADPFITLQWVLMKAVSPSQGSVGGGEGQRLPPTSPYTRPPSDDMIPEPEPWRVVTPALSPLLHFYSSVGWRVNVMMESLVWGAANQTNKYYEILLSVTFIDNPENTYYFSLLLSWNPTPWLSNSWTSCSRGIQSHKDIFDWYIYSIYHSVKNHFNKSLCRS